MASHRLRNNKGVVKAETTAYVLAGEIENYSLLLIRQRSELSKTRDCLEACENLCENRKETVKVVFDSSFLFIPSQFQLDIFEELTNLLNQRFDPILLSPTQEELQKLAEVGSPKISKQALLALKLAEKCRLVYVEKGSKETHDDVIVRMAVQWKCPAATNDRELRKRLRNLGVPVIFLRQKQRLELDGAV